MLTVDHGAFPGEVIRELHPLPAPSAIVDGLEVRRARALMVEQLEAASSSGGGHTLQSARDRRRRRCPAARSSMPAGRGHAQGVRRSASAGDRFGVIPRWPAVFSTRPSSRLRSCHPPEH